MLTLITVVGNSIFTNTLEKADLKDFKSLEGIESDCWDSVTHKPMREDLMEDVQENITSKGSGASAEIASISQIIENKQSILSQNETLRVHLLATDTVLSRLAAELIQAYFEKHPMESLEAIVFDPEHDVIADLGVSDEDSYERGMQNLIDRLLGQKGIIKNKDKNDNKYDSLPYAFNFSSGYKAVTPFLTLIAQLKEIPMYYLYQGSEHVMEVGNLPFSFDLGLAELYARHLSKDGLKKIAENPEMLEVLRDLKLVTRTEYKKTALGRIYHQVANPTSDERKGNMGHYLELQVVKHFLESGKATKIKNGKTFFWQVDNQNLYFDQPQHQQDENRETPVEIDVMLDNEAGHVWCEVKAASANGVKKACEQLETRRDFWRATDIRTPDYFYFILYKLVGDTLDQFNSQLQDAANLLADDTCTLKVFTFDIPLSNKGIPNWKKLSENPIELRPYDIPSARSSS